MLFRRGRANGPKAVRKGGGGGGAASVSSQRRRAYTSAAAAENQLHEYCNKYRRSGGGRRHTSVDILGPPALICVTPSTTMGSPSTTMVGSPSSAFLSPCREQFARENEEDPPHGEVGVTAVKVQKTSSGAEEKEKKMASGLNLATLAALSSVRHDEGGDEDERDYGVTGWTGMMSKRFLFEDLDDDSEDSDGGDDDDDRDQGSAASSDLSSVTDSFADEDSCISSLPEVPSGDTFETAASPPPAPPGERGSPQTDPSSRHGVLPSITSSALDSNSSSERAARYVSSLLTLSRTACGRSFILATGTTVQSLVECMVRHVESAEVVRSGCDAIARLSARPRSSSRGAAMSEEAGAAAEPNANGSNSDVRVRLRDAVVGAHGVRAVLRGMRGHYGNGDVQAAACGALRNLSGGGCSVTAGNSAKHEEDDGDDDGGDAMAADVIAQEGGLRLVVRALTLHTTHLGAVQASLGAIQVLAGHVAAEDDGGELRNGAMDGVAAAMARNGGIERIQAGGCSALRRLAASRAPPGATAGGGASEGDKLAGAVTGAVVSAMHRYPRQGCLQAEAGAALYNLSLDPANASALKRDASVAREALQVAASRFPDECGGYCRAVLYRMKRSGKKGNGGAKRLNRRRQRNARLSGIPSSVQIGVAGPNDEPRTPPSDVAGLGRRTSHGRFAVVESGPENEEARPEDEDKACAASHHAPSGVNQTVNTSFEDESSADEQDDGNNSEANKNAPSSDQYCDEVDTGAENDRATTQGLREGVVPSPQIRDGIYASEASTNIGKAACDHMDGCEEVTPPREQVCIDEDACSIASATFTTRKKESVRREEDSPCGNHGAEPSPNSSRSSLEPDEAASSTDSIPRQTPCSGEKHEEPRREATEDQTAQTPVKAVIECCSLDNPESPLSTAESANRSLDDTLRSAIERIDAIRAGSTSDSDLQQAFVALRTQTEACSASRTAVAGALPDLVRTMCERLQLEPIQAEGCALLANLCRNKGVPLAVAAAGGLSAVATAMREHGGSERVQAEACRALCDMCSETRRNLALVKRSKSCRAALKRARKKFPASCGASCGRVLTLISTCPKASHRTPKLASIKMGADFQGSSSLAILSHIYNLKHKADTLAEEHALVAIGELGELSAEAPGNSVENDGGANYQGCQAAIIAGGGISTIVACMAKRLDSPFIQRAACTSLNILSDGNGDTCERVTSAGGVEAVIASLSMHPHANEVQISGLALLHTLIRVDQSREVRLDALHKAGGIPVVTNAMKAHREDERVQEKACGILFCFSQKRHIASSQTAKECIRCIVSSLRTHPESKSVQHLGCGALCRILDSSSLEASLWSEEPEAAIQLAADSFPESVCQRILEKLSSQWEV